MTDGFQSGWPAKLEIVRRCFVTILWATLIIFILYFIGRYFLGPSQGSPPNENPQEIPQTPSIESAIPFDQLNKEILTALQTAKFSALETASNDLDSWVHDIMERVDPNFLDWYFSYWTQQKMQLKGLYHNAFHLIYSRHPPAEEIILQQIEEEFEKRVLQQGLVQKELEVIAQKAMNQYVKVLRQELNLIAKRHKIPKAEWERYLEDISLLSQNLEPKRTVPLALKGIISFGSGIALSKQIKLMISNIREKIAMKLASKGAVGKAVKTAGKVLGKLFGPAIAVATVAWDVWDHTRSEKEYRPILKESIRSYFLLVKETMLNDRDMGILGVILDMENHVMESLQAGQAQ
jgi:hypothetical protein